MSQIVVDTDVASYLFNWHLVCIRFGLEFAPMLGQPAGH